MEKWKRIKDFPNYSVSNEGRVKNNTSGRIIAPWIDTNGYPSVHLGKPIRRVHKLVAEAFVPNPFGLSENNHKDGDKTNCNEWNLEWCTHGENVLHSYKVHGGHSTRERAVVCIETGVVYSNAALAAKAVNRSPMAIKKCLYGWTKTSAGKHWRFDYDYQNRSDSSRKGNYLETCESRGEEYGGISQEQGIAG